MASFGDITRKLTQETLFFWRDGDTDLLEFVAISALEDSGMIAEGSEEYSQSVNTLVSQTIDRVRTLIS